jgi:hypothetical protein
MQNFTVASNSTMKKIGTQGNGDKEKNTLSSTISSSKKITSSKVVTKTVVSSSSITKTSGKNVQQFKTSESSKIFSEKSWSSSIHDGSFGSSLQQQKTVKFESSSSEKKEQSAFSRSDLNFDEQRALHLKQGARPKTTASTLMHSSAINSKLDPSFELHPDIHIPSSIRHPSPTAFKIKEVWEEGFSLFPEYFPDVYSAQNMRERFQHSVNNVNVPVKESKLLSCSTKQYSWEKLDGDEESEAQKIANSWLQIFGESEPRKGNAEIDRKAIKNS